jgi:hypothetical protein
VSRVIYTPHAEASRLETEPDVLISIYQLAIRRCEEAKEGGPATALESAKKEVLRMSLAPDSVYLTHPECLVVLFDLRQPGAAESLHRQRAAWADYSDIEAVDADCFALIVRPGWAAEPAA